MTIRVLESGVNVVDVFFNLNLSDTDVYDFELTSQYSHQTIQIPNALISSNQRYSRMQLLFPAGYGDEHKNGIYNWTLKVTGSDTFIEKGLAKIITEPGGNLGTIAYDAGTDAEERVADVYFRPNY